MQDGPSEDLLTVELSPLGREAAILRLEGEVDLSSAHLLSGQFKIVAKGDLTELIIDATAVTFMDSTGLHALVEGKRLIHDEGTRILLVPSPQVRRVLELVFPEPLFAARMSTVDEARAALDSPLDDRTDQAFDTPVA
jgi:anti-anti-sigma factor